MKTIRLKKAKVNKSNDKMITMPTVNPHVDKSGQPQLIQNLKLIVADPIYFKLKDKVNFKYWADETKKWATVGDQFMKNINSMEAKIEK